MTARPALAAITARPGRPPARPSTSNGIMVYRAPWPFPCDACGEPVAAEAVDVVVGRGVSTFETRSGHPRCAARLRREAASGPDSEVSCAGCGRPVAGLAVALSRCKSGHRRGHRGCLDGLLLIERRALAERNHAAARAASSARVRGAVVDALGDLDPRDELDAFATRLRDALTRPDPHHRRRSA